MKNKLLSLLVGVTITLGCSIPTQASTIKEERKVSQFSGISLSISATLYLTQGSTQKVIIEGDDDVLEKIETEVRNGKLRIKTDSWKGFEKYDHVNIYITVEEIEDLMVTGSGDILAETPINADEVDLTVTGSGAIKIPDINANEINSNISGSGDIKIDGKKGVEYGKVYITGSGDCELGDLDFKYSKVYITGSGGCRIHSTGELDVTITGSGKVYYSGDPLIDASITGSGRVRNIDD